ncbi:MAG TPA: N-acetylmuramoyl-L-alanine amidase, partial [Actinomycetota bacterium]|nr:N-acetylmuramoyl-L-alanine amidase [Actinomycetota bacterium]
HAKTFPILRETKMTAVVFEPAYVTNADEERLITDIAFQGRLAAAVVEAIQAFVREPSVV